MEEFLAHRSPFVTSEIKKELIEQLGQEKDLLFIEGDTTRDEALIKASIQGARTVRTTLPDDAQSADGAYRT